MKKNLNLWEVIGKIVSGVLFAGLAILAIGILWFYVLVPTGKFAWNLFNASNPARLAVLTSKIDPNVNASSKNTPVSSSPVSNTSVSGSPVNNTSVSGSPVSNTSVSGFPQSTTYTIEFLFEDNTKETKVFGTDFDLEDSQELWDRIQKVGLSNVVVTSDSNLVWFYNGYIAPLPAGKNSLGEIWRINKSNDPYYNAGFAIRNLANGCSATASKWEISGKQYMQAQTAVSKETADWLLQYCAKSEMDEWFLIREELGMPENPWTK